MKHIEQNFNMFIIFESFPKENFVKKDVNIE
jgi:hypothetical protein